MDAYNDGLPDAWEFANFGNWTLYNGGSDPDGDGITNLQEYLGGTDPSQAATNQPDAVASVTGRAGVTLNMVEWTPAPNAASYKLYWSTTPNFGLGGASVMNNVTSPVFHKGLTKGTTYYYKVVASNSLGDALPSPQAALKPNEGIWQAPAAQLGDVVVNNVRGKKAVFWVDNTGGQYAIHGQRYLPGSGWQAPELIRTSTSVLDATKLRAAMNNRGDIAVVWLEADAYRVVDLKGMSYSASAGTWTTPKAIDLNDGNPPYSYARDVVEIGELVLKESQGIVVWGQRVFDSADSSAYEHIYGAYLATNAMSWGSPFRLDANASDLCGDSYTPHVDMADTGDAVFEWYRCGTILRSYLTGKGLQSPLKLQSTNWWNTAVDVTVNGRQQRATAIAPDNNAYLWAWDVDLATNTVSAPVLVRRPKGGNLGPVAYAHLSDDGKKYFAWTEGSDLYALARTSAGDVVTKVASAARGSRFADIQSVLGFDQTQVLSWRSTADGYIYVARYKPDTLAWVTQWVNQGSPATKQCTATDGLGYIDTVTGTVLSSFTAPAQ